VVGLLGHYGWRLAFLVHLSALLVVPLALAIPTALGRSDAGVRGGAIAPSEPFLNMPTVGLLIIAGLSGMSMMLSPIYGPIYLASLGVTDTRLASIPLTIGAAAAVLAAAAYGRVHQSIGVMGVFVAASALMGVTLLIAGFTGSVVVFTVAMAGMSAMVALLGPNLNAAAVAFNTPIQAARAIGIANGVMFGAQLAFPFVAAWVRGLAGLSGVFLAFGIAMMAVALLAAGRQLTRPRLAAS
jgi:hypothetical protein